MEAAGVFCYTAIRFFFGADVMLRHRAIRSNDCVLSAFEAGFSVKFENGPGSLARILRWRKFALRNSELHLCVVVIHGQKLTMCAYRRCVHVGS